MNKKRSTSKASRHSKESRNAKKALFSVFIGCMAALVTALALCAVLSFIALRLSNPSAAVSAFSFLVVALSSLAGGFAAFKTDPAAPLTKGLLTGGGLLILCLLLSLAGCADTKSSSLLTILSLRLSIPLFAIIGAILAAKPKKKKLHVHR